MEACWRAEISRMDLPSLEIGYLCTYCVMNVGRKRCGEVPGLQVCWGWGEPCKASELFWNKNRFLMRYSNDVEQEVYGLNYLENSVFVVTH
jgi:hypothetical protein